MVTAKMLAWQLRQVLPRCPAKSLAPPSGRKLISAPGSPPFTMIVTTAQLFKHAYGKYAVGAYNINNAEQAMGLFKGCIQSKAPFIIQISKGARKYTDKRMLEAIIRTAGDIY